MKERERKRMIERERERKRMRERGRERKRETCSDRRGMSASISRQSIPLHPIPRIFNKQYHIVRT